MTELDFQVVKSVGFVAALSLAVLMQRLRPHRVVTGSWRANTGLWAVNAAVLGGNSTVMFTSYVPMQATPWFYAGIILFAVGALIGCFIFFATLVIAKGEKTAPVWR